MTDQLTADAVDHLAPEVRGPVLLPGRPGYDTERLGFDLSVDHHPAIIVGATGAADVQAAVRFAAGNGLPVAVQATGHGPTLSADGAMMISTRRMDDVRIAVESGATARIGAGVRWRKVLDLAGHHGLAPLSGSSSNVGAVGYTLGGGMGPIARTYGFAADHVRRIDVVTADGTLRRVSAGEEPDLFWGLRGGKGNFGVVTSIEVDLMPLAVLYGGVLVFPGEAAGEVLHTWRSWTEAVPEEMTSSVALMRLPDLPFVPEPLRNRFTVHVRIGYVGPRDAGAMLVEPLRQAAVPVIDTVREMPYVELDVIHNDPTEPMPVERRTAMLRELDRRAVQTLLDQAGPDADISVLIVELRHLGGALSRLPRVPNAVGNRDAAYNLFLGSPVLPGRRDLVVDEMDSLTKAMAPWATGGRLLNFLAGPDAVALVQDSYPPDTYRRLARLKATYDPANMFRINHNIPPE